MWPLLVFVPKAPKLLETKADVASCVVEKTMPLFSLKIVEKLFKVDTASTDTVVPVS